MPEQQLDQLGRAAGLDRHADRIDRRPRSVRVVRRITGQRPAGIGAGLQQQPHGHRVALGDCGAERARAGHVAGPAEQQPQALAIVSAEAGEIQVVIVGHRAAFQQQPGNRRVGGAGYGAAQHRPVPADPGVQVGPGVQQQLGHGQQPARPGWVQPVPPRGADGVQRRPAPPGIGAGRRRRVALDLGAHPGSVAEQHCGGEVVPGDLRRRGEHAGGEAGPVPDAGLAEGRHLRREVGGALLHSRFQLCPAGEPVVAGDGELSAGQGELAGHRPDPAGRRGITGLGCSQQVLGLVTQLVQVGPGRKNCHDVSFTGLRSACQATRRSPRSVPAQQRWTLSCPRTRRRPPAPPRTIRRAGASHRAGATRREVPDSRDCRRRRAS